MDSFINFYNNLSDTGLFFFWAAILLFIFLIILSVVLIIKNRKLVRSLDNGNVIEEQEELPIIQKEITINKEEVPEIKEEEKVEVNIKMEPEETPEVEAKEEKVEEPKIEENEEPKEEKIEVKHPSSGLYQKNVLRQMNGRMQTSPISISSIGVNKPIETEDYDEYVNSVKEESMVSPLEEMEDVYSVNDNMKFVSDAIKKMEEEKPSENIELTEYEKRQEEEAIISYDELLKVKDKIYNITDDEETDEFIDELKNFRLDLE